MKKIHTDARKGNRGHRWPSEQRPGDELRAAQKYMKKIDRGLAYLGLKGAKW